VSLRRPAAKITVDGQARSIPEAAVAALCVDLGLGAAHDRAMIALWPKSHLADAAPGAELSLQLGYGDELSDVFTGVIETVDVAPAGVLIEALSKTAALSRTRVAQAYLQQSVADIVRDLVQKAGADTGQVDADAQLHVYHADERRPVWQHLLELARLASCDLYGDADGKVCVTPPRTGDADKRLRFGAELVTWQVGRRIELPDPEPVVPYGAASEAGSDGWHLVLREPDGAQPSGPSLVDPAVRERDLAKARDRGRKSARDRKRAGGEAQVTGDADLRPGSLIELADVPGADLGTLRATSIRHVVDAARGFLTVIAAEVAA
jgi:phage protein D